MRILIIEDDPKVASYVARGLRESGHVAETAEDGRQGLEQSLVEPHDVLIVDRMLPAIDGVTLVRSLRERGVTTPVLFLSALAEVEHRVEGLQSGGDDYLTKPFAFSELLARVEALHRRNQPRSDNADMLLSVGDLSMDLLSREVRRGEKRIELQPREYQLLEYLVRHAGQVLTRTMLLEKIWNYHFDPQTNVIDVHISRLRQKIDRGFDKPLIHTVRGAGYVVRQDD